MADKTIKVKLVKSTAGCKQSHRDTVRGMINKVYYLVQVVG